MRFCVSSNRVAMLCRVSSIALLGGLIAGCSSGFQRFDTSLYDSATPQQTSQVSNPYPGDVDGRTTASTSTRFAPVADVAPATVPQGVYHKPEPAYAAPQSSGVYVPQSYEPYALPQAQSQTQTLSQAQTSVRQPLSQVKTYSQTSLPKVEPQETARYNEPEPEIKLEAKPEPVYISEPAADPVVTSAVKSVSAAPKTTKDGWSSAGGTMINVGQGETLYNISKRYGVPVSAIREVNGMNAADSLQAGQSITIPNYVFTKTSSVSAPDNDPATRAARASRGYIGESNPENAIVPVKRPIETAAVTAAEKLDSSVKSVVSTPMADAGAYIVQSGDSLSRVASKNGTTVAALQAANGLAGTNINVGQKLILPSGTATTVIADAKPATPEVKPVGVPEVEQAAAKVDPIKTASLKPKALDDSTKAPARTGISEFRWPVKGRVVSTFGESGTNGTNEGIDISVPEGTAVHAAENGVVIYAGEEIKSYGKLILVRHSDGWVSAYAHNRDFEVKKGDNVRRGQIIARSGRTGDAGRPKLHFELRKDSKPVNPKKYLAT